MASKGNKKGGNKSSGQPTLEAKPIEAATNPYLTDAQIFEADDALAEAVKYSFKYWWVKLTSIPETDYKTRSHMYLRTLRHLPGSYKIWFHYLTESMKFCEDKCIVSQHYAVVNGLFDRSLIFMHKMPRIWMMYLQFLFHQKLYNRFRATLDRALSALPLTQHFKIWEDITQEDKLMAIKHVQVGRHIMERFMKINPDFMEPLVEYLIKMGDWRGASSYLVQIINDERFVSQKGTTPYQFCMQLCEMVSTHPTQCVDIDGEAAIRNCIAKYTDQVGNLWNYLAEFYISQALFEKARDVFEEALEKVSSARDFGIVYSAYLKFEESLLELALEEGEDNEEVQQQISKEDAIERQIEELLGISDHPSQKNADYRISKEDLCIQRVENLIERRAILLNTCLLRQSPNNVDLWLERLDALEKEPSAYIRTFHECLVSIDPFRADGARLSTIWIRFAGYYESIRDMQTCNKIFWKATQSIFRSNEDYVSVWVSWIETLLRIGAYQDARTLIDYPLTETLQDKKQSLNLSNRLWSLSLDIELNFGDQESLRRKYNMMMDLNVVTPLNILNFANYLIENSVDYVDKRDTKRRSGCTREA